MFQSDCDSPTLPNRRDESFEESKPSVLGLIPAANPITSAEADSLRQRGVEMLVPTKTLDRTQQRSPSPRTAERGTEQFEEFRLNPLLYERTSSRISQFNSRFQSGNLSKVADCGEELLCLIDRDNARDAYGHWYYFEVHGLKGVRRLRLIAFRKRKSLYQKGMRPCVRVNGVWGRGGSKVSYSFFREVGGVDYYSLSFEYDFGSGAGTVAFAYCYPYTYSDLLSFLKAVEVPPKHIKSYLKVHELGKSPGGRGIPLLRVSSGGRGKAIVVVTGRAHPGESVGSFAVEGLLKMLLGQSKEARLLRDRFQFLVIPMLNVDGVATGNYRFNMKGFDLNRKWMDPDPDLHPQVLMAKAAILQSAAQKQIAYVFDFHGHSRKDSYFFYGCLDSDNSVQPKLLPTLLSEQRSKYFSADNCSFNMSKDKAGTLRLTLYRQLLQMGQKATIYTVQSSFHGNSLGQWSASDYSKIGPEIFKAVALLSSDQALSESLRAKVEAKGITEANDSGSDSCPEEGEATGWADQPVAIAGGPRIKITKQSKTEQAFASKNVKRPRQIEEISHRNSLAVGSRASSQIRTQHYEGRRPAITQLGSRRNQSANLRLQTKDTMRKRPSGVGREEYVIPTVYFGEHGGKGELKCLLVTKMETKQLILSNEPGEKRGRGNVMRARGYHVRRIKFQHYARTKPS